MPDAIHTGLTTIIAADETLEAFEAFATKLEKKARYAASVERLDFGEMRTDRQWDEFECEPLIVTHSSEADQAKFATTYKLTILPEKFMLAERNRIMATPPQQDIWTTETKPAHQLLFPNGIDPFDKRTPEEREKDASRRAAEAAAKKALEKAEEAAKADAETLANDPVLKLIEASKRKGQPPNVTAALVQADPSGKGDKAIVDAGESLDISPDGVIAVYHRITVPGYDTGRLTMEMAMDGIDLNEIAVRVRKTETGVWAAFQTKAAADEIATILRNNNVEFQQDEVNDRGDIVGRHQGSSSPRPWGSMADVFNAMPEDEQEANMLLVRAEEMLFCGKQHPRERNQNVVFIVPREHFDLTGEGWEGKLYIDHLLPEYMTPLGNGRYVANARWETVNYDLQRLGMAESVEFLVYCNGL